ncbi:MAG: EamA family transporter, partial [Clostridia bacterium]|nr:EamA family transporter [Clostridia bacterium]
MEQKQKTSLLGTLLVLLAGISWGTSGIFVRYFTAWDLSTMQQTFFKVAVAGTLMLLYCLLFDRSALKIRLKDLWVFLGAGVISLTFFTWCYFSTIQATSMSTAAILLYLAPTLVMLMSSVLFKEQITKQKVVACILAFAGCVFVSGIIGNATPLPLRALVTGLLSALGYALYSIFGQL